MIELKDFDRQDLINLQKVMSLNKSEFVSYEKDGKIYSTSQRGEKAYGLYVDGSNESHVFIFDKKNKHIHTSSAIIEPSQ